MPNNVQEIKNVPHSPGTSDDPLEMYNPLDEPFTWTQGGKPYTIPAKSMATFPEYRTRLFVKHLARKIVYGNFHQEIEEKAKGQLTPDTAKAVPGTRVERMEAWLLSPTGISPEGEKEPLKETKLEDALTSKEKEVLAKYRAKVENLKKAREARKPK